MKKEIIRISNEVLLDSLVGKAGFFLNAYHESCGWILWNYKCVHCKREMTDKEKTAYKLWEFNHP